MAVKKRSEHPDWTSLRYFLELARNGSLSATARAMGVTHATVARRISSLEAELATPLFERQDGRYVVTDHGDRIRELAQSMEDGALTITRVTAGLGMEITGRIRITTTEFVATYLLVAGLGELHDHHPRLEIELSTDNRNLSLARHEADIALRLARPETGNLVARKVADIAYHLYAAPELAAKYAGRPLPVIAYDDLTQESPEARHLATWCPTSPVALRTNNQTARRAAAEAGLGMALVPRLVGERSPGLVMVDTKAPPLVRELWLLVHPDMRDVPRVREVVRFLIETLGAARAVVGPKHAALTFSKDEF